MIAAGVFAAHQTGTTPDRFQGRRPVCPSHLQPSADRRPGLPRVDHVIDHVVAGRDIDVDDLAVGVDQLLALGRGILGLQDLLEGQLTTRMTKSCAPGRPISVYEIHGTADTVLPYGGGGFLQAFSAPASARKWAALDHCAKTPRGSSPSHSVKVTTYVACRGSAHVALRTLVGGVHRWAPGIGEIVTNALPWRK